MKIKSRPVPPLDRWKSISFTNRHKLPDEPGVYAVCVFGIVYYIGKAKSLKKRWRGTQHHRYHVARLVPFSYLRYTEVRLSEVRKAENSLIHEIDPPWNYTPDPIDGYWGALFWHLRGHNHSENPPVDWIKLALCFGIGVASTFLIDRVSGVPIVESIWNASIKVIQDSDFTGW